MVSNASGFYLERHKVDLSIFSSRRSPAIADFSLSVSDFS